MMQYIDVLQSEAENEGKIKPGYEKWAYSWKKVIPDTPEEIEAQGKIPKAIKDIKDAISIENPDIAKWKIEEIVARIKAIETILQIRR
jgi:hypothetical protein